MMGIELFVALFISIHGGLWDSVTTLSIRRVNATLKHGGVHEGNKLGVSGSIILKFIFIGVGIVLYIYGYRFVAIGLLCYSGGVWLEAARHNKSIFEFATKVDEKMEIMSGYRTSVESLPCISTKETKP